MGDKKEPEFDVEEAPADFKFDVEEAPPGFVPPTSEFDVEEAPADFVPPTSTLDPNILGSLIPPAEKKPNVAVVEHKEAPPDPTIADRFTSGLGGAVQGASLGMRAPLDYATAVAERSLEGMAPIEGPDAIPRLGPDGKPKSGFEQSLEATRAVRKESEQRAPGLHAAGQFGGTVGSAFIPASPVGFVAKAAQVPGKLAGTAASFAAPQIFRTAVGKGVELATEGYLAGGAFGAAHELDQAIEKKDFEGVAEKMASGFHDEGKHGAAANVVLGGALNLITKGLNARSFNQRANELAFKGLGGKKRDIYLANTRIPGGGNAIGEQMLKDGVITKADTSIEGTAWRAEALRQRYGKELEAVREEAAALVGDTGGPSLSGLADKIEQEVIAPVYKNEVTRNDALTYRTQHKHLLEALEEHRPLPPAEPVPMPQDPEQLGFLGTESRAPRVFQQGEQGSLFGERPPVPAQSEGQLGLFPYEAPTLGPTKKDRFAKEILAGQEDLFSRRYPKELGPQPGQLPLPGTGPTGQMGLFPKEPPVFTPGPGRKGQIDLFDPTRPTPPPTGLELPQFPPTPPAPPPPPNLDVLDMQRLNDWRIAMDQKAKWTTPEAQGQADMARSTRAAMDEYWMEAVEKAANQSGQPELIERVKDLKLKYAKAAVASDLLTETAARKAANRTFSMSDTQVGQVAALASDLKTGGLTSVVRGVVGAATNKYLREQGNFLQSSVLHGAAKRAIKVQTKLKNSAALKGLVKGLESPKSAPNIAIERQVDVEKAVDQADKFKDPESDEAHKTTSMLQEMEVEAGPQVVQALRNKLTAQADFILKKAGPAPQPSPFGGPPPKRDIDPEQKETIARSLEAIRAPEEALARVGDGTALPEDYEVLEELYPKMWQEFQQTAVHGLADKNLGYDQQLAVAEALKLPLHSSMDGSYLNYWQGVATQGAADDAQKKAEEEAKANLSGGKGMATQADRSTAA